MKKVDFAALALSGHGQCHPTRYELNAFDKDGSLVKSDEELPAWYTISEPGREFDWLTIEPFAELTASDIPGSTAPSVEALMEIQQRLAWVLGLDRKTFETVSGKKVHTKPGAPRIYTVDDGVRTFTLEDLIQAYDLDKEGVVDIASLKEPLGKLYSHVFVQVTHQSGVRVALKVSRVS